jgi:hypothetical protein
LQADVVLVMEQDRLFTQLSNQLKVGALMALLFQTLWFYHWTPCTQCAGDA